MTTKRDDSENMADLLGYHLDLVDAQQRERIAAGYDNPESLQAACDAVQHHLSPLDFDRVPPPSPQFMQNILQRVQKADANLPFSPSVVASHDDSEIGTRGGPFLSMREVIGLAAAILIFVGIFIPGYRAARFRAQKIACANNLRQIGTGFASYAEMNGSQWPYVGAAPLGARWYRTGPGGPPSVRNSRHVYRLVRGRLVPAAAFCCPSRSGDLVLQTDQPEKFDDFPDPRNNSYATNFVTGPWNQRTILSNMPIAAGMTPLVDQNRRLIRGRTIPSNSQNHGRSGGQNVLNSNISVRFHISPNVGVEHDDIYRVLGVQEYNGLERPRSRSDAFLIP